MKIPIKLKPSQIEGMVIDNGDAEEEESQIVVQLDVPTPVALPLFVLLGGYGLLWVSTWRCIDNHYFIFIGLTVLIALVVCTVLFRRIVFSKVNMMVYYSCLYAFTLPLAREITHTDIIQVPATIASFAIAVAMFVGAIILMAWQRKNESEEPSNQS